MFPIKSISNQQSAVSDQKLKSQILDAGCWKKARNQRAVTQVLEVLR